jgi:hypothetical protein
VIRQSDAAVRDDAVAGFSTLISFCIGANSLVGASNGDSALVVASGEQSARELTSGQPKNPPVGSGDASWRPFATTLVCPWTVLALSDGVWKYAGMDRVLQLASNQRGHELVSALQVAAQLSPTRRFQDDFTVVLLESPQAEKHVQ